MTAPPWISPAEAMDMLYDVRAAGCEDLGFALLRPRSRGRSNTLAALATAKLQPVEPDAATWRTRCGMAVTARDHRLVLAPGVVDPLSLARFLDDYDAATRPQQRLIAAVLTMRFDPDRPLHDGFDRVLGYATSRIARARRLSSLVVLHVPATELADAAPHAHIVLLARAHRLGSGFGALHADLHDEAHPLWADEWRSFAAMWNGQGEG